MTRGDDRGGGVPPSRPPGYAAKYPALAKRRARPAISPRDYTRVSLGHTDEGQEVFLDEVPRLEHLHAIGATGSGKTTFLAHLAQQDFRRGRGGIVLDPHGSHPDSLYHNLLAALDTAGFTATGRVHLLDPNITSHVVGFNPLAPITDTDPAVIADAMLEAFERAWGDEDTHAKPTIRSVLKATFTALCELNLPLTAAKTFYDPIDRYGLRARVITQLDSTYARDELERLHETALDEKSHRDFRAEVRGPINRINEFVSSRAIELMLGEVDRSRTLDLLDIMDRGHILLVNLQHGKAVSAANTQLLGALLLRYVFLLAGSRSNREPFFVTIDECHRYLTGDVPNLLAEVRKNGIAMTLAHQYLAQLGKSDDLIAQALLNSTEIKAVFRVKSPLEAQLLAEMVVPLDLETPVQLLIKPAVVGHELTQLKSASSARHQAESHSTSESQSFSESSGITTGSMIGMADSVAIGDSAGQGQGVGQVFTPDQGWMELPQLLSQTDSTSSAQSRLQAASTSRARSESTSHSTSESHGISRARGHAIGASVSEGAHEAFKPTYADLPSAVHSKENLLYRAGELIRVLPPGRAFIAFRGKSALVTVPSPSAPRHDGARRYASRAGPRRRARGTPPSRTAAPRPHAVTTGRRFRRAGAHAAERRRRHPGGFLLVTARQACEAAQRTTVDRRQRQP
jgi:hypothetical protein